MNSDALDFLFRLPFSAIALATLQAVRSACVACRCSHGIKHFVLKYTGGPLQLFLEKLNKKTSQVEFGPKRDSAQKWCLTQTPLLWQKGLQNNSGPMSKF